MCRIVVYARSTPFNSRTFDEKRQSYYLRGDVVVIVADGVFLGADMERGYPLEHPDQTWWRVIELPGIAADDARFIALLARDPGNVEKVQYVTDLGYRTWKRDKNLPLDTVETLAAQQLGRPLALGEHITIAVSLRVTALSDSILTKVAMPRSAVIG